MHNTSSVKTVITAGLVPILSSSWPSVNYYCSTCSVCVSCEVPSQDFIRYKKSQMLHKETPGFLLTINK